MPTLKFQARGPLVSLLNSFLVHLGFRADSNDYFGGETSEGTKQLQTWLIEQDRKNRKGRIQVDGIAGNQTLGYACGIDRNDNFSPESIAIALDVTYPARNPNLNQAPDQAFQEAMFGFIDYKPAPTDSNPERIKIINDFVEKNIVVAKIPQIIGKANAPASGQLRLHRLVAPQLLALFAAWESVGILGLISTFDGLWEPRFVRGSQARLSNHSWGTAFDINASANWLNHLPAFPGENGCLFPHVEIAQDYGFNWGGFYRSRLDGMHFEAVKILSADELQSVNDRYLD